MHDGFLEFIRYLVNSREAKTQIQNCNGELPLHLILRSHCAELDIIDLLISSLSICIQDKEGNTPLHVACLRYDIYNFRILSNPDLLTAFTDTTVLLLVNKGVLNNSPSNLASRDVQHGVIACLSLENNKKQTPLQTLLGSGLHTSNIIMKLVEMFRLTSHAVISLLSVTTSA